MNRIRCLSLHQPWASLIAIGAKRIETRSWGTNYRGPLAIHAAKSRKSLLLRFDDPFDLVLLEAGIRGLADLPLGGIVAVAELVDCVPVGLVDFSVYPVNERAFGNYVPGRYAWLLENVRRVDPMIPLVGRQGLFTVEISSLPEGILNSKSESK
jgi:hypothetical protein